MAQTNDDPISQLDEVLDEHEEEEVSYIGKTFLYRCVDCGVEKYVKGDELDDVICEECGGDMQIADEGIYDEAQAIDEELAGKTETEVLQDETEEIHDLPISDENTGNVSDLSETEEVLEDIDLELDLEEDEADAELIPEDDKLELDDDDEDLSEFEELIPDFDDDDTF